MGKGRTQVGLAVGTVLLLAGCGQQAGPQSQVMDSVRVSTSAPLSSLGSVATARTDQDLQGSALTPNFKPQGSRGPATVGTQGFGELGAQAAVRQAPPPAASFVGLTNEDNFRVFGGRYVPPDTVGDVGPTQYVQSVNTVVGVFSKTGQRLITPVTLDSLWADFGPECREGSGDPIVMYDHLADRWIISQMRFPIGSGPEEEENEGDSNNPLPRLGKQALPPGDEAYECVAVSTTGDATGSYYRYGFKIDDDALNDYPKLGVWPDGYYMSFNMFDESGFAGVKVAAVERAKMLQGLPAKLVLKEIPALTPAGDYNFTVIPSDLDGPPPPPGTPNTFVMYGGPYYSNAPRDLLRLWTLKVNWNDPEAAQLSAPTDLPIDPLDANLCDDARNCIPQKDSNVGLDPSTGRIMLEAQYRYWGSSGSLVLNHTVDATGKNLAGIRWYELRAPGASTNWSVKQTGNYVDNGLNTWMGGIGMNKFGDIALGYSTSSAGTYPAIHYTVRQAKDYPGQMRLAQSLVESNRSQFRPATAPPNSAYSRWGDYSALSVDPTDDCTFWYTNEYYDSAQSTRSIGWTTRIGSFRLPGCTP